MLVLSVGLAGPAYPAPTSSAADAANPPAPATPAGLTTAVLSIRRVPTFVAQSVATASLRRTVTKILANPALHAAGASTCLQVTQDGRTLLSVRPDEAMLPASNQKLLTATAALDRLGPDARFTTTVRADRAPAGGVEAGNLYLVGAGDPLLRSAAFVASLPYPEKVQTSLESLAAQIKAAGITRLGGSVVADEARYDAQRGVATWKPSYLADGLVGPLSAVDVNDGFVPTHPAVGGSTQPAMEAASTLTRALQAMGVTVVGPPVSGATPSGAVAVTSISSPPMIDVLGAVLRTSDDTAAELITKELGKRFGGAGTTAAGVGVAVSTLAADGLAVGGLVAADGSGLDRGDRVSCSLLVATLSRAGANGPLASMLPVAARTGTLANRMADTPAAGRLIAKTGTLDDVSALSGFVLGRPGGAKAAYQTSPLVFSLIDNGVVAATGEGIANDLGAALAAYPSGPDPANLVPAPVVRR